MESTNISTAIDPAMARRIAEERKLMRTESIPAESESGGDGNSAVPVAPVITRASVRVMRSYDYSHFEVTLSCEEVTTFPDGCTRTQTITPERVDALRKEAALLADKAVAQFKIAKEIAHRNINSKDQLKWLAEEAKAIEAIPEGERSPNQVGRLKAYKDAMYWASVDYQYQDDFEAFLED